MPESARVRIAILDDYLMVEAKKSISAAQIQRTLDIKTYKTAWYLCHRIRAAMREANPTPLTGTVEADETYVGGRVRGKGKGYVGNKAIVAGVIQRGGPVRLQTVPKSDWLFRNTLTKLLASDALTYERLVTD